MDYINFFKKNYMYNKKKLYLCLVQVKKYKGFSGMP